MRRDPRFANWSEGFFRVELDAMLAIVPDAFRACLNDSIAKHFDKELYEENRAEANEANGKAEGELRELYAQLEDVHQLVMERIDELNGGD